MRLVLKSDLVHPPGHINNLVTGTERAALLNTAKPYWVPQVSYGRFSAEYDGLSNTVEQFMQRNSTEKAGITFVDEGRFIRECQRADVTTVRLPLLVKAVRTDDGRYYSALPLAVAKTVTKTKLGDVLSSTGFTVSTSEYFKLPMDSLDTTDYTIGDLFGATFSDMWDLVRSLARFGPAETMLQMLQLDGEYQQLYGLSSMLPAREVAATSEIDAVLSLIAAPSLSSAFTTVSLVNAMQAVRYAQVMNPEADSNGLTLFFYYAMQHSAFLTNIPADVYRALGTPDNAGVCTIGAVGGQSLSTPLKVQLPLELRQFGPQLAAVSDTAYNSIMRARVAHRLLCVIRFLEAKGIKPSPSYRFSTADREKLFKIIA